MSPCGEFLGSLTSARQLGGGENPMGKHGSMSPHGFPGHSADMGQLGEPGSYNILLCVPLVWI